MQWNRSIETSKVSGNDWCLIIVSDRQMAYSKLRVVHCVILCGCGPLQVIGLCHLAQNVFA